MKTFRFIIALMPFILGACSAEERQDSLAVSLWQKFQSDEAGRAYAEDLDPETLALQNSNTFWLRDKIPQGYPEPYFPLGRLQDKRLDPRLNRETFLNENIIELGRRLFFDTKLSYSAVHGTPGHLSCSSCHQSDLAFTDGLATSKGVDGAATPRNSPTLLNAAYYSTLTWANPVFPILEMQARIPLFGDDPVEMGLRGREQETLQLLLESDSAYRELFQTVFQLSYPEDFAKGRIDYNHITAALAAYERSLISFDTRFDRFLQGQETFTPSEDKGARLFFGLSPLASGETLSCSRCHSGILLSNSYQYVRNGRYFQRQSFHNTGLYNVDGHGAYPKRNEGFATPAQLEARPELMGQFRVPALRFVGKTAPYGHDGSLPTLEAVIRHYAAGGRAALTPMGQNPYVDSLVKPGFTITDAEIKDLLSFLQTLHASGPSDLSQGTGP
jgi:cytochrome c peroxidase